MPGELTLERSGGVAVITLRAPERRNALTVAVTSQMWSLRRRELAG